MLLPRDLRKEAIEHVEALARRRNITVRWVRGTEHRAALHSREVWSPPITTAHDYLNVLHEIGHIASPKARRKGDTIEDMNTTADEVAIEGAAWAWAAGVATPEIVAKMSERDWADIGRRYLSYVRHWSLSR